MLKDKPISFVPNDLPRKWLIDEELELIVWYYPGRGIAGFELVYDRNRDEHSLRWLKRNGYQHHRIDSGEDESGHDRTPILVLRGDFPKERVMREFESRAGELSKKLREFVLQKLEKYEDKR